MNRFIKILKPTLIFGGLIILLYLLGVRMDRASQSFLKVDGTYAIGTITSFIEHNGGFNGGIVNVSPHGTFLKFKYIIKNKEYTQNYGNADYFIGEVGQKVGDRFLVFYHNKNPKESIMLFLYPIKDSSDLKKYIDKFKSEKPKLWGQFKMINYYYEK